MPVEIEDVGVQQALLGVAVIFGEGDLVEIEIPHEHRLIHAREVPVRVESRAAEGDTAAVPAGVDGPGRESVGSLGAVIDRGPAVALEKFVVGGFRDDRPVAKPSEIAGGSAEVVRQDGDEGVLQPATGGVGDTRHAAKAGDSGPDVAVGVVEKRIERRQRTEAIHGDGRDAARLVIRVEQNLVLREGLELERAVFPRGVGVRGLLHELLIVFQRGDADRQFPGHDHFVEGDRSAAGIVVLKILRRNLKIDFQRIAEFCVRDAVVDDATR